MDYEQKKKEFELKLQKFNLLLNNLLMVSAELFGDLNNFVLDENNEIDLKDRITFTGSMLLNENFLKLNNLMDVYEYISDPLNFENNIELANYLVEKYVENSSKVLN